MTDFLTVVLEGFAKGAPRHHHLVVKAHPLEDGRAPLRRVVKQVARDLGVADRVHFVRGGKLAQLLNDARTAVTVNSTAGQQVLWRGIPLKVFGSAVYAKPEFVSDQPLAQFFAAASRPDNKAYKDYRRYLLETSQVPGGFYAARARTQDLRERIEAGEEFEEVAREHSEDEASSASGGDLGVLRRGQTVKAFETAAFDVDVRDG